MRRRHFLALAGGPAALALPGLAAGQSRYPSKPVRIVIPFAPDQGSDVLARALSDKLAAAWGQPVLVDNKAGANGTIAAQELLRAPRDGHTLLLTSNSPVVINPNLYKQLPYNVEKDFVPVALLTTTEMALVVTPKLPVNSVAELIAHLRANPDKLSYASPGVGSTSHLTMESFKQATKTSITHVPYKGSAPAMTDLMSGTVHLMMDALPSSLPHAKAGRIRMLAITGDKTPAGLSGVVTMASAGVAGLLAPWYGIFVASGVDPQIVQKLHADFQATMQTPELQSRVAALAMDIAPPTTPQGFGERVRSELRGWERTVRSLGLYQSE